MIRFIQNPNRVIEILKSLKEPFYFTQEGRILIFGYENGVVSYFFDAKDFNQNQIYEVERYLASKTFKRIVPARVLKSKVKAYK